MNGITESNRQIDQLAEENARNDYAMGAHWESAIALRMAEDRASKSLDGTARYYATYAAVITFLDEQCGHAVAEGPDGRIYCKTCSWDGRDRESAKQHQAEAIERRSAGAR